MKTARTPHYAAGNCLLAHQEPLLRVGFVLLPEFHMLAMMAAIEPLRVANHLMAADVCKWSLFSVDGDPVVASNEVEVRVEGAIEQMGSFDVTLLCASTNAERYFTARLASILRRWNAEGRTIGGIDSGTQILARAGLLTGRRATANYNELQALREKYRSVDFTDHLFEIDGNKITCAAGTVPIDLMLHVLRGRLGDQMVTRISGHMFHERVRESGESQVQAVRYHGCCVSPLLKAAVALMEQNVEQPLAILHIAQDVGVSVRELERLFRRFFRQGPSAYFMRLRLQRAYLLLEQTELSVLEIAVASGFKSAEHFARRFKRAFGQSPRDRRATSRLCLGGETRAPRPFRPSGAPKYRADILVTLAP